MLVTGRFCDIMVLRLCESLGEFGLPFLLPSFVWRACQVYYRLSYLPCAFKYSRAADAEFLVVVRRSSQPGY
jgi:hypothetical protein